MFKEISLEEDETEHSLEMQYPFIKYAMGERKFKVVPIMVGRLGNDDELEKKYA